MRTHEAPAAGAGRSDEGGDDADPAAPTLLRPGHNCWRVETAGRAAVLIDAAAYFLALRDALERARRSVLILGWDFDGNVVLAPTERGRAAPALREYLPDLLERRPALELRILVWGFSIVYGQSQGLPPQLDSEWPDHPRLHFRFANDHPVGASHHEKLVCVDGALAFAGGIDLTALRWDVPTHDPDHPARVDARGKAYGPKHDVQIAVDGDAARALAEHAAERWRAVAGEDPPGVSAPATAAQHPWPDGLSADLRDVRVGIARTRAAHGDRPEVREAERLTLDMLSAARRHVYVETQYLTSTVVGDRLVELLERPGGPAVVALVRRRADGVVQRFAMGENRDRLLRRLACADRESRLRAMYPVVLDPASGEEYEIDVHDKLVVADDRLLRIGSSNLNNRSMGLDSECDLVVEAGDDATREAIRRLTARFLAEHLGRRPAEVASAIEARGLLGALDALNGGPQRRLVAYEREDEGPSDPLPGTPIVDPGR